MPEDLLHYVVHMLTTEDSSLDDVPEYIIYSSLKRFK